MAGFCPPVDAMFPEAVTDSTPVLLRVTESPGWLIWPPPDRPVPALTVRVPVWNPLPSDAVPVNKSELGKKLVRPVPPWLTARYCDHCGAEPVEVMTYPAAPMPRNVVVLALD
jgi:hypothetical protein